MLDIEIRAGLKKIKLTPFYQDGSSKIVDEFRFPSTNSRIDVAVINCSLHGYEIKSSRDTLSRLPGQLFGYTKILDYLHIVTEPKHIKHIENIIPNWVGLTVCQPNNDSLEFIDIKQSLKNPHKEAFHIAKLLWREEIIDILISNDITFRKKDRNWLLCETLAANFDLDFISNTVRNKLKVRDNWKLND